MRKLSQKTKSKINNILRIFKQKLKQNKKTVGLFFYDNSVSELKSWRISQLFENVNSLDERRRCLMCGKMVINIRNHYYVHFPGKYACSFCRAVYTRSDTLLFHMRAKHPDEITH